MVTIRPHRRKGRPVSGYVRGRPGRIVRGSVRPTAVRRDTKTGRLFGRYKAR